MNCLHSSRCILANLFSKYLLDVTIKQTLISIHSFPNVSKIGSTRSTLCGDKIYLRRKYTIKFSIRYCPSVCRCLIQLINFPLISITLMSMYLMKFIFKTKENKGKPTTWCMCLVINTKHKNFEYIILSSSTLS